MTKKVLVAAVAVAALFAFSGCSQQTAEPEVKKEAPVAEVNKTVEKVQEVEVQLVEEVNAAPHSMKEMAVEVVETVK